MKKLLSFVLILVLCFSFSACGEDPGNGAGSSSEVHAISSEVESSSEPEVQEIYRVEYPFELPEIGSVNFRWAVNDKKTISFICEMEFNGIDKAQEKAVIDLIETYQIVHAAVNSGDDYHVSPMISGHTDGQSFTIATIMGIPAESMGPYADFDDITMENISEENSQTVHEALTSFFDLVQQECHHDWADADCENPKHCKICALEEGESLGHTTDNGTCERCGEDIFKPLEYSGKGDSAITYIVTPSGSIFVMHLTHSGSRNFIVKIYDANENEYLAVNAIGAYDGVVMLPSASPMMANIQADGNWSAAIEKVGTTTESSFSGTGDYVTPISTSVKSGSYRFTHDGSRNFAVRMYTVDGSKLLVNEIGAYDGTQVVSVPSNSAVLFQIKADGNWTIEQG